VLRQKFDEMSQLISYVRKNLTKYQNAKDLQEDEEEYDFDDEDDSEP
jgi:hypothetical protein